MQAYFPVCSVVEDCQQCDINYINYMKLVKASATAKKQLDEDKVVKNSIYGGSFLPLLGPITDELLGFVVESHEQGMIVDIWRLSIRASQLSRDFKSLAAKAKVMPISHGVKWHYFFNCLGKKESKKAAESVSCFQSLLQCKTNTHWPKQAHRFCP